MSSLKTRLTRPFTFFLRDTSATVATEAVLILPLLAAWFVGSFVFFDAFKSRNTAMKASYTIGDVLSRRTDDATPAYLDNLHTLYKTLVKAPDGTSALRVTMIMWDGDAYQVQWSHASSNSVGARSDASAIVDRIPTLSEGEQVILVETFLDYNPAFNVGLNSNIWENFVVTSPRFASKLDCPECAAG